MDEIFIDDEMEKRFFFLIQQFGQIEGIKRFVGEFQEGPPATLLKAYLLRLNRISGHVGRVKYRRAPRATEVSDTEALELLERSDIRNYAIGEELKKNHQERLKPYPRTHRKDIISKSQLCKFTQFFTKQEDGFVGANAANRLESILRDWIHRVVGQLEIVVRERDRSRHGTHGYKKGIVKRRNMELILDGLGWERKVSDEAGEALKRILAANPPVLDNSQLKHLWPYQYGYKPPVVADVAVSSPNADADTCTSVHASSDASALVGRQNEK